MKKAYIGYILFRELGEIIDYFKLMNYEVLFSTDHIFVKKENERFCISYEGTKYRLEGGDWFKDELLAETSIEEFKKKLIDIL